MQSELMQCGLMRYSMSWRMAVVTLVSVVVYGSGPLAAQPAAPAAASDAYYARYATPGMCKYAARRMDRFYWRDKRPDTVRYAPATDSIPRLAVATARACAARFTVATVKERELIELARLYLLAQQDTFAQAAVERLLQVTAQQPARERGWALLKVVRAYLQARPTRLDQARRYLAQLDALGPPAGLWRMWAHRELSLYAWRANALPSAIAEGNAARTARAETTLNEQIDWSRSIVEIFRPLPDATGVLHGAPAAVALLDRATVELTPLQRALQDLVPRQPGQSPPPEQLLNGVNGLRGVWTTLSTPVSAPPLHAAFRYTNGAPHRSDTTARPRRGEVTLLVFVHRLWCWAPSGDCFPMYATLKRLQAKYASAGLRIVLQTETAGYFRTQLTEDSATEAELMRGYLHDFVQVPGTVAIETIRYTFRPPPDGRREYVPPNPNPNAGLYPNHRGGVLTDRQGHVRLTLEVNPQNEAVLDAMIAAILKESPTAAER